MTALVACETVLLVLLVVLVAGLLRSHAEILRRLGPVAEDSPGSGQRLPEPARRAGSRPAAEIAGLTLERDAVKLGMGPDTPPTLLAFLSSGCSVCESFWRDLREGEGRRVIGSEIRVITLTKDPSHESPSRLRALAGELSPVVMSSRAWRDYAVPAAPYFVYADAGQVLGEGSASAWSQIESLLRDAIEDLAGSGGEARTREVDRVLAEAGIGPGHPSLYPGRSEKEPGG